jgi:hypothetical protein
MKKLLYIILLFGIKANASIINVGDTTLTSNWNAGGNILNITGKISGAYQISNAIIQANPFIQIFDTTVTFGSNIQCERFSAMWYGSKTANADNSSQLQLSINACINRPYILFIPSGVYKTSKSLWVSIYDSSTNKFLQSSITIKGTAHFWGDGGSQIKYSGDDNAINFQLNKGTNVSGLIITGGWVSPSGSMFTYFNLTDSEYTNQGTSGNGIGLAIDPTTAGSQTSGSTGCFFNDMQIGGFRTLIRISNNSAQNGEILLFDHIQFGPAYTGVTTTQPQEKGNEFRHIYSWSSINYLFRINRGNYYIDGLNIAGRCRNLFWVYSGGFFPSYVKNVYAESIGSIGSFIGGLAMDISNSLFDFAYQSDVGKLTLLTSNASATKFSNCNFRYYGNQDTLKFSGPATFSNCTFSGTVVGATGSVFINNSGGQQVVKGTQVIITDTIKRPNSVRISIGRSNITE